MNELTLSLIAIVFFGSGWCISYAFARLIFRFSTARMRDLEARIREENPRNIILWRRRQNGYFLWMIHFCWIVLIVLFEAFIFAAGVDPMIGGIPMVFPMITLFFVVLCALTTPLQALESSYSVVVANDNGIRLLRPGLRGRQVKVQLSWDAITSVVFNSGSNTIANLGVVGPNKVIWARVDAMNFEPLCSMLIKYVPEETFSEPAYRYCRLYADS